MRSNQTINNAFSRFSQSSRAQLRPEHILLPLLSWTLAPYFYEAFLRISIA